MGSCPLLIYKDTRAAISPKMGRGRTYSPDYTTTPAAEDVRLTDPVHYSSGLTAKAGGFSHITLKTRTSL